jgi:hypothetical protein
VMAVMAYLSLWLVRSSLIRAVPTLPRGWYVGRVSVVVGRWLGSLGSYTEDCDFNDLSVHGCERRFSSVRWRSQVIWKVLESFFYGGDGEQWFKGGLYFCGLGGFNADAETR